MVHSLQLPFRLLRFLLVVVVAVVVLQVQILRLLQLGLVSETGWLD